MGGSQKTVKDGGPDESLSSPHHSQWFPFKGLAETSLWASALKNNCARAIQQGKKVQLFLPQVGCTLSMIPAEWAAAIGLFHQLSHVSCPFCPPLALTPNKILLPTSISEPMSGETAYNLHSPMAFLSLSLQKQSIYLYVLSPKACMWYPRDQTHASDCQAWRQLPLPLSHLADPPAQCTLLFPT